MESAIVSGLLARDPRAIARALTLVVDEAPEAASLLSAVHARTGHAYLIGITGPPGAGKSTLVDHLIAAYRAAGDTVGVLAVDPTSPFTGGAILGDRVRMQAHASDPGVFIRSLATRGDLGGVPVTAADAASVLDAAGFDVILIETVGVGQDEIDVARLADVTVVVLAPGAGDEVQALKAGIMEAADIFAINKADVAGADRAVSAVQAALSLGSRRDDGWEPPVERTVATEGTGVAELVGAIARYRTATVGTHGLRRLRRARHAIEAAILRAVRLQLEPRALDDLAGRVTAGAIDVHQAAASWLRQQAARAPARPAVALDHVAIVVRDAAEVLRFLEGTLGLVAGPPEEVPTQSVRVRFVPAGPVPFEIVEPAAPGSPVEGFLDRRGPGLHHVALRVDDLTSCLRDLDARGIRLIDRVPRPGAHGASVAFVHPAATGGVLVELIQKESRRDDR